MDIPSVIYLQVLDELREPSEEVTWCQDRIHQTDIPYYRRGAAQRRIADLEAECDLFSRCLRRATVLWLEKHPGSTVWPDGAENIAWLMDQFEHQRQRIAELEAVLDCRAGRLLSSGRFFVVVAEEEPYFADVYDLIRLHECDKGDWTEEDEATYQDAMSRCIPWRTE